MSQNLEIVILVKLFYFQFFYKENISKTLIGYFSVSRVTNNNLQIKKILFKISRTTNLPIFYNYLFRKIKKCENRKGVIFYKIDEFYKYMYNSKFVIISGGMSFLMLCTLIKI